MKATKYILAINSKQKSIDFFIFLKTEFVDFIHLCGVLEDKNKMWCIFALIGRNRQKSATAKKKRERK